MKRTLFVFALVLSLTSLVNTAHAGPFGDFVKSFTQDLTSVRVQKTQTNLVSGQTVVVQDTFTCIKDNQVVKVDCRTGNYTNTFVGTSVEQVQVNSVTHGFTSTGPIRIYQQPYAGSATLVVGAGVTVGSGFTDQRIVDRANARSDKWHLPNPKPR